MWISILRGAAMATAATLGLALAAPLAVQAVETAVSSHPRVPAFERFFANEPSEEGGRVLLGELNCTSCHKAEEATEAVVSHKQAPRLDAVGSRVRLEYLRRYLADPHGVKPGTTMPNVLASLPENQRTETVEALVHYLSMSGSVADSPIDRKLIEPGEMLYHQVGCVACHGPRKNEVSEAGSWTTLGTLSRKYSINSLATFLQNPHEVRPSGRMPSLNLTQEEARGIASYLLEDLKVNLRPSLRYAYYEGSWSELPNFSELEPKSRGESAGFDLTLGDAENNFAFRFEGFLILPRDGDYSFHLMSDDGSILYLDDKLVVDNNGIHAPQTKTGSARLAAGAHRLRVDFLQGNGGYELSLAFEGAGLPRQPVEPFLSLTEQAPTNTDDQPAFVADADLAAKGRELFASVGCAACHAVEQEGQLASELTTPTFAELKPAGGCLANGADHRSPNFHLNETQQRSLALAIDKLRQGAAPLDAEQTIAHTLTTFNCYACHERGKRGGVEKAANDFFATTQKEMGDEGRIPPLLEGVGAKLQASYLKHIFDNGPKDRPYMLTRMPKFGSQNVGELVAALEEADPLEPLAAPEFERSDRRVKVDGRRLVGDKGFGCVKCHNFRGVAATGVQALDLTTMTERLRHDWFHRYVIDPQAYRPGTRMPSAWPNGKSPLKAVLDGDTQKQIESVWLYLADGGNAAPPYGLGGEPIELIVGNEAVIYRNFIEGAGVRAIGVGYPEGAHLAFDANELRLALIWQNAFIDASKHWVGRGAGWQPPLGDNPLSLPTGPAFATLDTPEAPWPTQTAREADVRFEGYQLGEARKPTFRYRIGALHVEDYPEAVAAKPYPSLRRKLTLHSEGEILNLWFRAATADTIESLGHGWYSIGGDWKMRLTGSAEPTIRNSAGKMELLVPVTLSDGAGIIEQEFVW